MGYLMLYEATHLIVKPKEAESTAYWGSMILVGYLVAMIVDFCVSAVYNPEQPQPAPTKEITNGDSMPVTSKDVELAKIETPLGVCCAAAPPPPALPEPAASAPEPAAIE